MGKLKKTTYNQTDKDNTLSYSIIIPVYNDPNGIKETLACIRDLDFPHNKFEVLVVDNASDDDTADIASKFAISQKHFRLLCEKKKSSYAARNKGISQARGRYLLFIDANMTVEKRWLNKIERFIDQTKADYFGMRVEIKTDGEASVCHIDERLTGFPVQSYLNRQQFAPTCCLGVSKTFLNRVGTFDSRLVSGGDQEFGQRVAMLNAEQFYASDIVIYHPHRVNLKSVLKKNYRIGRGMYQLGKYYPERYSKKVRNILNPIYLLPTLPSKYIDVIRSDDRRLIVWRNLNSDTKFKLLIIWWLRKLAVHMGYVTEFMRR